MSELTKRIRAKFPGAYDDLDDATLEKQILAKHPEYADLAEKQPEPAKPQAEPGMAQKFAGFVAKNLTPLGAIEGVKSHPVETLATLGGLLAAPLTGGASIPAGMAAAGLGAAGGAGLAIAGRQLMTGKPESGVDTAKTMAAQGAGAALGEGTGRAVVGAANVVVPKVLKGILRPGKGLQQEFGDVVGTMRNERIPVGKSDVAQGRMMASAGKADQMIADAQAAGAQPIPVSEIAKGARPARDTAKLRVKLGKPDETPAIAGQVKALKQANPGGIPLTDAQTLKREAQDLSSRTFRAIDRGNPVNDIGALTDKGIATALRQGIEARVPGVADVNQRTQSLLGLTKALTDAEARSGGVVGFNPANWLSGLAPGLGSQATFLADRTAQAAQNPIQRTLRQALIAALAGEQRSVGPD